MRFHKLILHSVVPVCLSVAASFAQSLVLTPNGTIPTSYSTGAYFNAQFSVSGGLSPYCLTAVSGNLPTGLTYTQCPGTSDVPSITGTLTAPGTYTFSVVAYDSTLPTPLASNQLTFTITVTTLPVVVSPLNGGSFTQTAGVGNTTITLANISGGNEGPSDYLLGYTAQAVSGNLPPGATTFSISAGNLDLSLSGVFSTPGVYNFSVVVSDTSTPTPVTSAPTAFTITVTEIPLQMSPTAGQLPGLTTQGGIGTVPYAIGGIPPYTWTITRGTPPPGLTFNPAGNAGSSAGATISYPFTGSPSAAGTYSFTIQVQDSSSPPLTISQTYIIGVISPVAHTLPGNGSGTQYQGPTGIAATAGSNAALWFTQTSSVLTPPYAIESINVNGAFQYETPLPTIPGLNSQPSPQFITAGPDGYLWTASNTENYIYRVKPDGSQTVSTIELQYPSVPPDPVIPTGIASGNDEGVWFTGNGMQQSYVGRISADGTNAVTWYPLPQTIYSPLSIVQDPADSNHLWFLAQAGEPSSPTVVVGRIGTDGTLDLPSGCQSTNQSLGEPTFSACLILNSNGQFLAPDHPGAVQSVGPFITVGADGAIWFASGASIGAGAGEIGRITPDGSSVSFFPVSTNQITSLALGSDNAIWYTNGLATLGRVTTSGENTPFNLGNSFSSYRLSGLTSGPDGALWVTDYSDSVIYQIFPSLALNCTGSLSLQLNVAINNPPSCTAYGGKAPYNYTYTLSPSNLPGVALNSATGVLSGTPTATGSFTISVTDSSSPAQQASQVIPIQVAPTIQLECNFPQIGGAAHAYSGSCGTAGGTPPFTYTVTPNLPLGLTGVATSSTDPLTSNTTYGYSVSGTIGATAYGTFVFTIVAVDSNNDKSTPQTVSIQITPLALSLSCTPNVQALAGEAFQQTCYGSYGTPPYTFSQTGLPVGLTVNSSTGLISGAPTAPGLSSVAVVAKDSAGATATVQISLSVLATRLAVLCPLPPQTTVGSPFEVICTPTGGKGPYFYASSALPAGLALNPATGVISGTPTDAGSATFTVGVADSESPAASAEQILKLFVQPKALTILSTTLPVPNSSLPYAVAPLVEGGTPPYAFKISSGALPGGLTLDSATGIISTSGTIVSGAYTFTVHVTDTDAATATQTYSGTVLPPLGPDFSSFALRSASGANGITVGPDGNLWFTTLDQTGGNLIGGITPTGNILTMPSANALTHTNLAAGVLATGGDIAAGADGEMWVAQRDGNTVGEVAINLSSQWTYVPPTANSAPAQITAAPDGTLWFTEAAASRIGHVGAGGSVVEFPTPSPSANPNGIAVGPSNLIVFTEPGVNRIGVIAEDGSTATDFIIPTADSAPTSIVLGPDHALWFTEFLGKNIGRIDTSGNITEYPVSSSPQAITLGSDGALYFTETAANKIGRITILGAVTEFPIGDANSGPTGIVAGPDGAIWFTENNLSKIARMGFIVAPIVTCTLPAAPLPANSGFSGSCTASQGTPPYTFGLVTSPTSTPPPGVTLNPTTGGLSGTLTTAGKFTFAVSVTDSSSPPLTTQQSYTFMVTPLPLTMTCNVETARLYTPYAGVSKTGTSQTLGCTAVNGTPPYTFSIASGTLAPGLSLDPATGNITGSPTTLGTYPITVQLTDSSTPPMVVSQAITILVQYGIWGPGGPGDFLFTLGTPPLSVAPGSTAPGLTLSVNTTLLQAVSGTAVLTFPTLNIPSGPGTNTPNGYVDPALQFVDPKGNPLGTTYNFTFQPTTTSITLPAIYVGTVLGTVDITISASGLAQTAVEFPVAGSQPVVQPGSVQFTNVTADGFDVEFIAMAPLRVATNSSITFSPASGSTIAGQQTFDFDITSALNTWFASAESLKYGGMFSLTFSFQFNGSLSAIGSATVTLGDNGLASQPVTGNR